MSSNGSFNTGSYGSGDWYRYLEFSWSVSSQSVANNTTTIYWELRGRGGATNNWWQSGNFKVVIDGVERYFSADRINLMNGTLVASGTVTMTHNSDGKRSFGAWAEAGIYYVAVNVSGSGSWDLPTIPRQATLTAADNFNDTGNPKITYSNPAGNSVTSLKAAIYNISGNTAYASYRDISKTGTSYTFNLTDAERNALRAATPNSKTMTVRFYVQTVIGGNTYLSYLNKTLTIVEDKPTFSKAYLDTNSTTVAITGNNQHIIRNKSTLQINVTNLSAKKSATISTVKCVLNGTTYNGTISGTSCTFNIGTVNSSSNLTAAITATDSRGFATTSNQTITMVDWVQPSVIVTMQRENNFYTNTTIKVDGSVSSLNSHNTMTLNMRYKKVSASTWGSWNTMQDNVGQTFALDNNYDWNVQVTVTDVFATTTYNLVCPRGLPIIYFDSIKSSVGVNCFPEDSLSLEVNGVPVNRNIMTYNLTSDVTSLAINTYTKIPLDTTNTTGSRLSASSNGIKIGKNVSKVLVSAQAHFWSSVSAGPVYIRVVKNGTASNYVAWAWDVLPAGTGTLVTIPPKLVDVAENDVLTLYYYVSHSNDKISADMTWLTVDVVG